MLLRSLYFKRIWRRQKRSAVKPGPIGHHRDGSVSHR